MAILRVHPHPHLIHVLRILLLVQALLASPAAGAVVWKSAQELTVVNAGPWPISEPQAGGMLRRLPFAAKGVVRDTIFGASEDTAGLAVRFRSDARSLLINASLLSAGEEMAHMPATGESGFDLYCFDEQSKTFRWLALWSPAGHAHPWPTAASGTLTGAAPLPPLPNGHEREFILYLPLYNGVKYVSIGVDDSATLQPSTSASPRPAPVVFYGTSITQGGVVSRPGMAFTNIIGRLLEREVLNFGYSGQGYMEISVASFLVKVKDAGAFVIDCNPNMAHVDWCGICGTQDPTGKCPCNGPSGAHGGAGPAGIRNRTVPLVEYIRSHGHPTTPIVLAEGTEYGSGWLDNYGGSYAEFNAALRESYLKLVAAGDKHVFYVFGKDLYANDTHAIDIDSPTAAGCHPTDVGHYRVSRHYSAVLPDWLGGGTNTDNVRSVKAAHDIYLASSSGRLALRSQTTLGRGGDDVIRSRQLLNCEPLPKYCPGQEGNNASCFACAKAHAAALAKDPGCTGHLIRDWCLMNESPAPAPMHWIEAQELGRLRGIPSFPASLPMGSPFHRFPAQAQHDLTAEMWSMSTWGSGTYVRFDSNASAFAINFTLAVQYTEYETLMPIDGTSGFDIYAYDTQRGAWLFLSNCLGAFQEARGNLSMVCQLASARGANATSYPDGGSSVHYMIYLPLYNGKETNLLF